MPGERFRQFQIVAGFPVRGILLQFSAVGHNGRLIVASLDETVAEHKESGGLLRAYFQPAHIGFRRVVVAAETIKNISCIEVGVAIAGIKMNGFRETFQRFAQSEGASPGIES